MPRSLQPARARLVEGGRVQFGTFDGPFERVNALDAEVLSGWPVPRALKSLRLKEWEAFQLGTDRWFVCVALFDAKLLALAQIKIYDRERREKVLFEKKLPPWAFALPDNMLDSAVEYAGGDVRIRFRNRLAEGYVEIELDAPDVEASITAHADAAPPQVVSIPFGQNHGMYSHKCLMPASGSMRVRGHDVVLDRDEAFIFVDDHKGYYPYEMKWDWLTAAGRRRDGTLVGFNLTRNQSIAQDDHNENCIWVDGALELLPPVTFERTDDVWRVRDDAGSIDVEFHVEMPSRVDLDALVVRSRYSGPFGSVRGNIGSHDVTGLFGMGEDFYLRV